MDENQQTTPPDNTQPSEPTQPINIDTSVITTDSTLTEMPLEAPRGAAGALDAPPNKH